MSTVGEQSARVNEMFEQAAKFFETAVHAGIKMQEETVRSLGGMMANLGTAQQWRQRTEAAAEKVYGTAQVNMDEAIRMMNENAKASLDQLQKAFEASREESTADSQARVREMWETTIGSLRRNTEVMIQANGRVLESWREMVKIMNGQS